MSLRVIFRERKSRALNPGTFGCLRGTYTINVTQGCGLSCSYCYARGYATAPPKGDVHLFVTFPSQFAGNWIATDAEGFRAWWSLILPPTVFNLTQTSLR